MRIFSTNDTRAKSRFWFFLKQQRKIRPVQGEIVSCKEIFEKKAGSVHNYGIVLRYMSRTGIVNMYKEYRDVTLCGAVSQMFQEMASRHKAASDSIHIVKASVVADKDLKRPRNITYAQNNVKFPKVDFETRAPKKSLRTVFKAERPSTIYS